MSHKIMKIERLLENKVVIITGSSRGIGRQTALLFAQQGARVIINYREQKEEALSVAQKIGKENSLVVQADVSKEEDVEKLVDLTMKKFNNIDILINNAGSIIRSDWLACTSDWNSMISSNLTSSWLVIRKVAPIMRNNKGSSIVNISSIFGTLGEASSLPYSVSKGGIITMTKAMAKELAPEIRVNAIVPGNVHTELTDTANAERIAAIEFSTPLKRSAKPDEISSAILFLASNASSFITGQILSVDGGYSLK
jgi:3-oxoacyl-[acyl-carrier protein] reductase